jgi:hypothetical protein
MSLASLPHRIPFALGGLVRPAETKAYGLTGVLPKRLPFSLSAQMSEEETPYGSVGWELICRAHFDFQTVLLRTTDMTSLTFSKELSAIGAASFSLDMNHPLMRQTSGYNVETLIDHENLWEIRFDGRVVFQALGTAVADSMLNANEVKTVTVTGSGIARVLEWASVYPVGFPDDITFKLETFQDDFSGEALNNDLWIAIKGMSYTSLGMRREAEQNLDRLNQEKAQLLEQKDNDIDQYNDEVADYGLVMKDSGSTAAEKAEALKQLNAAKLELDKTNKLIAANTAEIARQTQIKNFIGELPEDDNYGHLRMTLTEAGSNSLTARGAWDIVDSGVSVGVEPLPSTTTSGGQATTAMIVGHAPDIIEDLEYQTLDRTHMARMYTQRIGNNHRLVAEVVNNNEVAQEEWQYSTSEQRYWRIREDNGEIVFDTSPDNSTWTERFRSAYNWPNNKVILQFTVEIAGPTGVAPPISAYLFQLNNANIPTTQTTMQKFRGLLEAAQGRGVIPYVTLDFTDEVDSRGLAWIGKPDIDVSEGTKLSQALQTLTQVQQADWIMEPDFVLKAYQKTKEDVTIPPVYFTKEDVVFHEAGSQVSKDRTRNREGIANAIVGKNAAGQYAYVEDSESISAFQRREAFISAGNANDLTSLAQVLDSSLQDLKDEKSSWRVGVTFDQQGRRPFVDYDVGDWITVETVNSRGQVAAAQWRVVGIAIQLIDGDTLVELTLQSRMELLAERLKAAVDNLSASSAAGGTSLGSAISAATLIEQVTLAGLRDVVIPNPVDGDVLTFSNGFWVPVAPGDKTVPSTPEFTTVYSNVYYPADGVSVRAQAEISWTLPTNTDGSVITDGHHFELRYRPDVTADYSATWGEVEGLTWDEVYTWGQPTIPPITNAGWQILYVGFDELSTVIQELTPGVVYEIQIRAVDSSTPQHFSDWSPTFTFEAQSDTIAPPRPAPPVVASSMLGVQITHYLGQATGGTFNLPPDMAHLEVHVGGPAFYPSEETMVGKVIADQGLIRSGTPVIQTFSLENTEDVWVRVIAVDRAGNKSSPSNAVTSTINLIDDAHISDLTASKITAGTISSSIILAGVIKTAESGARAEMNFEGFRIFSEEDDPTVSLLGNPGTNGNFLLIKDLEDPTATLAGIDGTGRGSFQSISVANDITMNGALLKEEIIDPIGRGVIAIGTYSEPYPGGGPGVERGFLEISFIAEESRTYMICAVTEWESTVDGARLSMRLRDGGENQPTLALPHIQQSITAPAVGANSNMGAQIIYAGTFTPGLHRILWSFYAVGVAGANAVVNALGASGVESTTLIWVEDVGMPQTNTVIVNDAGVDEYNAPAPIPAAEKPPAPKPKITYTKNYSCTWSGTYRSNGDYSSSHGNTMVQGDSGYDSWLNDARSLMGFDYRQIMADLKGATIKACYITLYANHWYWNDGGTARIGTHNYTGRPGSWAGSRVNEQRVSSSNWPKPGKRKVSLGTTIGNEFKSGASKGIALGPTSGSKTQYGRFNGNGQSNEPVLTIVYVK